MEATDQELEVLEKISIASGMDSWFLINYNYPDKFFDKEAEALLPLEEGVNDLYEGSYDYNDYDLTKEECEIFLRCLDKCGIDHDEITVEEMLSA